jgi:hypothetical protein
MSPFLLAPLAAAAAMAGRVAPLRRIVFSLAEHFYRAAETLIPADPRMWHRYEIDWRLDSAQFRVDDSLVLSTPATPLPPLGLILWIDNQYALASPSKAFGFGVQGVGTDQWLEITDLKVEN